MQGPAFDEGGQVPQYPPQDQPQPQFQVPQQPSPGQPSGLTLGQAAGVPAPETASDGYINQYLQTVDALGQQFKQYKRPLMPDPQGPGLLESLATFGLANLKHMADVANVREDNTRREQQNMAVDREVNNLATKMVDAHAAGDLQNQRLAIANQGLLLRLLELDHNFRKDALNEGRAQVNDTIKQTMVPIPADPNQLRMRHLQGWVESKDYPGMMEHTGGTVLPKAPGGGYQMPGEGSVMGNALNAVGGAPKPDPNAPLEGEAPEDTAQRIESQNKIKEKLSVPTNQTRAMAEKAPGVIERVAAVEDDLKQLKGLNPLSARWRAFRTGQGAADPAFAKYQKDLDLVSTALMNMHVGARGAEGILKRFDKGLEAGKQSPANIQATLDTIKDYARQRMSDYQGGKLVGETTAPTQPTPATGTGVTPGGIKFRVLP